MFYFDFAVFPNEFQPDFGSLDRFLLGYAEYV
jgi:hypothetical protein